MNWEVMEELIQKTDHFVPPTGTWKVYYLGFARGGWDEAVVLKTKQISKMNVSGKNWTSVGAAVLNLEQVDQDLSNWE